MIKRVATSDLTFGHMPAPPPSVYTTGQPGVSEMLDCFTEQGSAVDARTLSPIAVVSDGRWVSRWENYVCVLLSTRRIVVAQRGANTVQSFHQWTMYGDTVQ